MKIAHSLVAGKLSSLQQHPLIGRMAFAVAGLFTLYLAFFHLGSSSFDNWDEAWYAEVTRNMLRMHEYFVMYWDQSIWLDKPPLYMWISALVSSVIGFSEFSMRVTSAISGVILILLVIWFSYKNYGIVPAFLAFVTLALNNVFVYRMRSANIDTLPALLIFLVFLFQQSKYKYKYLIIGLLFGLIFLARASLVLYPLLIFVITEILFERKNIIKNYKQYLLMMVLPVTMIGLWLLIGSMKSGASFYQFFLFNSDHGVSVVNLENFKTDYIMFAYYSLQRRFFFVLLLGVIFAIRFIKDKKTFMLLLYSLLLIVQLSFTSRSNNWYLIPSMAFWSLLIAFGTYYILKLLRNNQVMSLLVVAAAAFLGYRTFTINILPILHTTGNESQRQSGIMLHKLTKSDDVVIRLDDLYPSTIYYSERKVYFSPEGSKDTGWVLMSRADVQKGVERKQIKWLVGKEGEVKSFASAVPKVKMEEIKVSGEETILHVLQN